MAGLYIHIPFCRHKCSYCDFYSVARTSLVDDFIKALKLEISDAKLDEVVETIYFGGGTPSLLDPLKISVILLQIQEVFDISAHAEITLEANPEDVNKKNLKEWKSSGINRLSIGVQSLNDDILRTIKRGHTAKEALDSICLAQNLGFNNISADLIYGLPGLSLKIWEKSLSELLNTGIQHLSSYHLGLEPGTLMNRQVEKGSISLPDEDESIQQFEHLFEYTESHGFPWYEISNFAKPGMESRHNSSYWDSKTYLGFGPGAHSYTKRKRFWNKADLKTYIENPCGVKEFEKLSREDVLNDYLITHLRTRKGISLKDIHEIAPWFDSQYLVNVMDTYVRKGKAEHVDKMYRLKSTGLFISDAILKDIIYI